LLFQWKDDPDMMHGDEAVGALDDRDEN